MPKQSSFSTACLFLAIKTIKALLVSLPLLHHNKANKPNVTTISFSNELERGISSFHFGPRQNTVTMLTWKNKIVLRNSQSQRHLLGAKVGKNLNVVYSR